MENYLKARTTNKFNKKLFVKLLIVYKINKQKLKLKGWRLLIKQDGD